MIGVISGALFGNWLANNLTSNKNNIQYRAARLIWAGTMFYFAWSIYGIWQVYPHYQDLALLVAWGMLLIEGVISLSAAIRNKQSEEILDDWLIKEIGEI